MFTDMLIGGTAGVISRTVTAPLELYKTQRQNQYLKEANIRSVLKKEGIRYLWKGNMTNCMRVFPQFATRYTTFEKSKQYIFNDVENNAMQNFLSGGAAGICSMVTIYPLETIRTRLSLQMNKSHYKGPLHALKTLKIPELYRGLGISVLGFAPFSAFNFTSYYYYKCLLEEYNLNSTTVNLLAGGAGGITALTATYPTDLLRKHFQMAGFNSQVPKYNGIFDGFKQVVKNDGFLGLYRGLLPAYLRIFPCLAVQFWCLEKGNELLK